VKTSARGDCGAAVWDYQIPDGDDDNEGLEDVGRGKRRQRRRRRR
jgi:hypothetical protein